MPDPDKNFTRLGVDLRLTNSPLEVSIARSLFVSINTSEDLEWGQAGVPLGRKGIAVTGNVETVGRLDNIQGQWKESFNIVDRVQSFSATHSLDSMSTGSLILALKDEEYFAMQRSQITPVPAFAEIDIRLTPRFETGGQLPLNRVFWGVVTGFSLGDGVPSKTLTLNLMGILRLLDLATVFNQPPEAAHVWFDDTQTGQFSTPWFDTYQAARSLITGGNLYNAIIGYMMIGLQNLVAPPDDFSVTLDILTDGSSQGYDQLARNFTDSYQGNHAGVTKYWSDRLNTISTNFFIFGAVSKPVRVVDPIPSELAEESVSFQNSTEQNVLNVGQFADFDTAFWNSFYPGYRTNSEENFSTELQSLNQAIRNLTEVLRFEYFQDMNGSIVVKPPFYNLNSQTSEFFVLKKEDILSIEDYSLVEDQIFTAVEVRGDPSQMESEDLKTSAGYYVDWDLVRRYGFRTKIMNVKFIRTAIEAQVFAMSALDLVNKDAFQLRVQIVARPELRLGFPVYIKHLKVFGYLSNIDLSVTVNQMSTMSLTLSPVRGLYYHPITGDTGLKSASLVLEASPTPPLNRNKVKSPRHTTKSKDDAVVNVIVGSIATLKMQIEKLTSLGLKFFSDDNPLQNKDTQKDLRGKPLKYVKSTILPEASHTGFGGFFIPPGGFSIKKVPGIRNADRNRIPLSDEWGFHHYGSFSYGRGYSLQVVDSLGKGKFDNFRNLDVRIKSSVPGLSPSELIPLRLRDGVVPALDSVSTRDSKNQTRRDRTTSILKQGKKKDVIRPKRKIRIRRRRKPNPLVGGFV